MEQPAKIRRSSSTTVMAIAILVGGVGLTWWAWNGGGFLGCLAWPLAVAALVLGALMLLGGLLFGGEAKCPSCGEVLDTLLTTSKGTQLVSCPKCTDFARVQGGTLSAVPADAVDEHHV
ncbi:MAG: hypothetical protein K8H88_09880, partial [Sandaracinaceae bacterium]|nr:hypothetical protein [Sandaracinaceae bacterium]